MVPLPRACCVRGCVQVAAQDIRKGVATYAELRDNLSEGLRFYTSLQVGGPLSLLCDMDAM